MKKNKKKIKALLLFSGGLDSMLAAKVLEGQGIKAVGLTYVSPFFGAETARKSAEEIGINLIVRDFSWEHLRMMKNPKHGFGKNMNPCIDCHALMLRLAGREMKKGGFDFLSTGEVLGERPMSQNKPALQTVEKESGLKGKLLRPLSAKLFPETEMEKQGLVNREKLFDISGRSRKIQFELAKRYRIKNFPSPSGGCKLTEKEFSENLKKLFKVKEKVRPEDIEFLKKGRQIFQGGQHFIVGRNQEENQTLKELRTGKDRLAQAQEVPGPLILVRDYSQKKINREELEKSLVVLLRKYNPKARNLDKFSVEFI